MAAQSLGGKAALITGGAGGIGLACAMRLVADGAAILLVGRDEARLLRGRETLKASHPAAEIRILAADAGKADDVARAVDAALALPGRLQMVVATVGGSLFRPLLEHDAESFLGQIETNLIPPFLAVRAAAPAMHEGGAIVCISSNVAKINYLNLSAYVTAKAALEAFVRSAADELGARGIRVNAVRPGLVEVDRTAWLAGDERMRGLYARETPLASDAKMCAVPNDIAEAVRYLVGPEAAWVTGQSFAVDGGQELRKNPDLSGA
jgi:NAD(P)-dependent dehydrogenase (short-subunit alcohol dehydrogenase family)